MKAAVTWVLLANGQHAHILETRSRGGKLNPLADHVYLAEDKIEFDDKAGTTFSSSSPARSHLEPHHRGAGPLEAFAAHLADRLEQARMHGRFDRAVICAAPAMLGALRAALPASLHSVVAAECAKDLTKVPAGQIRSHLADLIAI